MSLTERLEDMRRGVADCVLVSFGDLSSGLVLRTSAARAPSRIIWIKSCNRQRYALTRPMRLPLSRRRGFAKTRF
ncbi:hypothetical protein N4R57_16460 [Rhodobacteraceae bacterium D3-12]|nr:hypothetical protein N4R57_16460 [Rhodobacteraceae bacterium D3-12]